MVGQVFPDQIDPQGGLRVDDAVVVRRLERRVAGALHLGPLAVGERRSDLGEEHAALGGERSRGDREARDDLQHHDEDDSRPDMGKRDKPEALNCIGAIHL